MKTADEEVLKAPTRTCCFCCDVRPATALFMIFEIAFFSALLFTGLINIAKASADSITVPYLGLLLCYLISLVGAVLVLYGVFTAKPLLLIPYLIKQLFTITLTLIFIYKAITVYFGHYGITVSTVFRRLYDTDIVSPGIEKLEEIQRFTRSLQFSLSSPTAARHFGGALLLGGCLALCVEIFVTDIVRKCYQYFRDKNRLATSSSRKN
ncbi:hypothetical protein L596_007356 [Steinernema carpocapsae]|nr:hypothetical protein L596_007356 [Steinernema carpocapsae]